ncbi:hypothetical protein ACET76_05860 [Aeromonas caviae]|uniref:hypothetical protein n=1 Tax=Aeromonas caviae TaxID=648 RepID=UPI0038D1FDCA
MSQIAPLLIFAHVVVPSQVLIMINTPHLSILPRSVINGLKQKIAHGGGVKKSIPLNWDPKKQMALANIEMSL